MGSIPAPELIVRKRDGGELTRDEIAALIAAYVADEVGDEQMAALLMAGVIRGFTEAEAVALTEALVASGETIDLSGLAGPTVDKHSTGGVGDTTTLIVGPLLAACGAQVAKLSGRGLGHTGGTLDKLEAIPGFSVDLSPEQLRRQVEELGLAVAAATADLVPGDKKLYALRDVTGTVASPALIASSVMSKKLAGGASNLVLDVKTGDGAFMPAVDDAVALARLCVEIGKSHGRTTGALVTDMSQPLGDAVGNALEVAVAVEVLQGEREGRLRELALALTATALELTGEEPGDAARRAARALDDGDGLEAFRRFVAAQGGAPAVADDPWEVLPEAPVRRAWEPKGGIVQNIDCRGLGTLAGRLGAGRTRKGEAVDPAVGLTLAVRVGDEVTAQAPAWVHARSEEDAEMALARLDELIEIGPGGAHSPPLVHRQLR